MADETRPATLAPPAVTALKQAAAASGGHRLNMERTVSQDMREEREDLKEAAEHSLNIIMDLDLQGKIRYVSPSWKDVIGTLPEQVTGKPVLDIIYGGADTFAETIESVRKYDSRSHIARFSVRLGPHSILRKRRSKPTPGEEDEATPTEAEEAEETLNLEAQGIMVYDRTTGEESHVRLKQFTQEKVANDDRPCGWFDHLSSVRLPSISQSFLSSHSVSEPKS